MALVGVVLLTGCSTDVPSANTTPEGSNTQASDITAASTNHNNVSITPPSGDVVEIKEKLFIAQTNDIYFNSSDYLGKTIKYEGIFDIYEDPESGQKFYSVIRYGPGCCGVDGDAGFEVLWNKEYPNNNDWVEAVGVLETYTVGQATYLRLALTELSVLPTRGAEYVSQ